MNETDINLNLVPKKHVTDEQQTALFTDPWYGLQNFTNYMHWNKFVNTEDPKRKLQKLAWFWELRSYFGLSFDQVTEMATNWNAWYNEQTRIVYNNTLTKGFNQTQTGVAYW